MLLTGLWSSPSDAAEFPQFAGIEGRDGWIEHEAIVLVPRLCGPALHPEGVCRKAGMRGTATSVKVAWELDASLPDNPDALYTTIVRSVLGEQEAAVRARNAVAAASAGQLARPRVQVLPVRQLTVRLRVDGQVVAEQEVSGSIVGGYAGELAYAGDRKIVDRIKRGEFQLEAEYTAPVANYRELTVRLDMQAVQTSHFEAFKRTVQSARKHRSGFLFFDTHTQTRKQLVEQSQSSSVSSSGSSQLSVRGTDVTPEMEQRLDQFMAWVAQDRTSFEQRHQAAIAWAHSHGRPDLAKLHTDYLDAVTTGNMDKQIDALAAVAAASSGDVLGFLAAGVAFGSSSSSQTQTFHAVDFSTVRSQFTSGYHELRIETQQTVVRQQSGEFPHAAGILRAWEHQRMRDCSGMDRPDRNGATTCLLRAVEVHDLELASMALERRAFVDARDFDGRTLLMRAALAGDRELAELLLRYDAAPAVVDLDGRSARSLAWRAGHDELAARLAEVGSDPRRVPVSVKFVPRWQGTIRALTLTVDGERHESLGADVHLSLPAGKHRARVDYEIDVFEQGPWGAGTRRKSGHHFVDLEVVAGPDGTALAFEWL